MKMLFQEPSMSLQPVGRIQPQGGRRPGHYGVHDRTIPFSGGRASNAFSINSGPIQRALNRSLRVWQARKEDEQRQQAEDYARRIRQEPQEADWEQTRAQTAEAEAALQNLEKMWAPEGVNAGDILPQGQYGQAIGPEPPPRKTLKELWENDARYPDFQEWKNSRPTHPGLDKGFFRKGVQDFDMHRGS